MTNQKVAPREVGDQNEVAKPHALKRAHVGLYLIIRFIATWFTATMIATFFAESLLNTVRTNKALATHGMSWLKNNQLYDFFAKFYQDGTTSITLVSFDLVVIYLFSIAVYAIVRFTYHKAMRQDGTEPSIGGLTWDILWREQEQPFYVCLCWLLTPRAGVHKKFFLLWMVYVFLFGITTSVGGLIGVSIYLSPELKYALYGGGVAFGFGLLEDLKFFSKIPPKEAIVGTLLALVTGVRKLDYAGTIEKISDIMASSQRSGADEAVEIMSAVLEVLKARVAKEDEEARARDPDPGPG